MLRFYKPGYHKFLQLSKPRICTSWYNILHSWYIFLFYEFLGKDLVGNF
uniref:Uncharacterized protein n=1 Tax=viral metagenome TaxID=1070528 RepID=A0A6C0ICD3_9ZZZZ